MRAFRKRMGITSVSSLLAVAALGPWPAWAEDGRLSYSLPSGMGVRLVSDRKADEVMVILGARAGIFEEPDGKPHLAHVAEHMLAHGAKPGSPQAEALARWFGANRANGETTVDMMYFDLHVPPAELSTALGVQAGRLAAPTFTREVLDREIPRALQEAEYLERSEQVLTSKFAASAFVQAAFYGSNHIPLKQLTKGYSIDDVRGFCTQTFRPERAILEVGGNIDPVAVRKEVDALFGKIAVAAKPAQGPRPPLKAAHSSATWDLATRHLFLAWPTPPQSGPDHPALALAAFLLTQRMNTDPEMGRLASFPQAMNQVAGVFYIDLPVKAGTDFDALEAKVRNHVAKLSQRAATSDVEIMQMRMGMVQMVGPVNLDAIPLPPNVSRVMALGNVELGAMRNALAWGDLPAYTGKLKAVDGPKLRDVVARHLDPAKATVVRLEPKR
jgi:hypothetical protein